MSSTIGIPASPAPEQFRAIRLQVFNWGTFSGVHDIPIAESGFLFVGKSGTGKSTLLDAFSALLIPPRWVDFNAAAREAERTGRDRSIMSYVRGAWAEQRDGESGDIATRYLRTASTWSALCLTYKNAVDQTVSLVQLFWVRGTSTASQDARRYYLIFQRDFDLREIEEFGTNFDIRKLKQTHSDAIAREDFHPYQERFCRLLGIESEAALRLLHKTQSAKNLGDLNAFLRDFMLDKPPTFEVVERLVNEFAELNAAHQAVITARQQVETLAPARDEFRRMQTQIQDRDRLAGVQSLIPAYRETRRLELLQEHIEALTVRENGLTGEIQRRKAALDLAKEELRELEQQQRDAGGDRIERWRSEKTELEERRAQTARRFDQLREACTKLGRPLAESPEAFAELVGTARLEIEDWGERKDESRSRQIDLTVRKNQAETAFQEACKEIDALKRQPSNIPADMLALRRSVADGAGISEGSLPFAGELIQVLPSEAAWQPAIERLLRNFALSLLVEDRHYLSVSRFINDTNLGQRLFYYRTVLPETSVVRPVPGNSLARKLETKESPVQEWLKSELRIRFDYECVENLQEFRRSERAITREGQIKHSKTRHEKDDRRGRDGRLQRLLGFDNREKRAEFERFAQELAEQITDLDKHLRTLAEKERGEQERRIHWQTIVNLQWQEIDVVPLVERISSLEMRLQEATDSNIQLRQLSQQVESARRTADGAERLWQDASVQHGEIRRRLEEAGTKFSRILANPPATVPVEIRTELDGRFANDGAITLDSIESLATGVLQAIHREVVDIMRRIAASEKAIEARFVEFARKWPADSGDVQTNLASAQDFFAKLARLEADGLPAHEHRFFELLRTQSHQNLAALATHLSNARKEILSRMEVVNSSLRTLPFNRNAEQTTYLKIEANDKQLSVVRDFRQEVQQALSHAWAEDDREQAEGRFLVIRGLVERLSSQNPEDKRWKDLVLDVRQHVEFIGRELDQDDIEVETYRSGAGKSGGQRQKLATTCLAAALRYQLGGSDHGMPQYSTVVLDEAFDKADNEFTALAMNIFISFGFQMIVACSASTIHSGGRQLFLPVNDNYWINC